MNSNFSFQGAPNPFDKATMLSFSLPETGIVSIVIHDMNGAKVAEVFNGHMDAGDHEIDFNNTGLKEGTYVFRLITGSKVETVKLTVVARPKMIK